MAREDHEQLAAQWILNGETAESISVVAEESTKGTQTYTLILDVGWQESSIASNMYEHDALGIAHALAAVLDCNVVEPEQAARDGA